MIFLCVIAPSTKTVAHTFLPSFDSANGCLYQKRLLRSRNFATMVTRRHNSPHYCLAMLLEALLSLPPPTPLPQI